MYVEMYKNIVLRGPIYSCNDSKRNNNWILPLRFVSGCISKTTKTAFEHYIERFGLISSTTPTSANLLGGVVGHCYRCGGAHVHVCEICLFNL